MGRSCSIQSFSSLSVLYTSATVNTGDPLAVVDVDTRNASDVEKVRALLDGLGVRIFAEVDTPSGGKHFCVAGHPELPSVHSTEKNQRLPGYPGVDIKSHGCNVFTPGTLRIKYGGLGYDVVFDELDRLPLLDDDEEGTVEFIDWVAELLAASVKTKARKTSGGAKEWAWNPCELAP